MASQFIKPIRKSFDTKINKAKTSFLNTIDNFAPRQNPTKLNVLNSEEEKEFIPEEQKSAAPVTHNVFSADILDAYEVDNDETASHSNVRDLLENINSKLSKLNDEGTDKHASIAEMQKFFSLLLEKYNDQQVEYEQTQNDFCNNQQYIILVK